MTSYKYEVITSDGKTKKGTIETETLDEARAKLRADGSTIVSLGEASVFSKDIDIQIGKIVNSRDLAVFCRQFESIINAGVNVSSALEMLSAQSENKAFAKVLRTVHDDVQKGETLADAMMKHPKAFPEIMIHMVKAGEASGSLDVAFNRVGTQFEKDSKIKGQITSALVYPAVLIVVIIVVVIIMMTTIVPNFTSTFDQTGGELPMITQVVIGISDFIVAKWYLMIIGIVALVAFFTAFSRTDMGATIIGKVMLKLPLVGDLSIKSASSRLALTMCTLMGSGLKMVEAVHIVSEMMSNVIVRRAVEKAEEEVKNGVALSVPLEESGIFPPMMYGMVRIGEETGNMEDMLTKIADYYDQEVESATKALMSALEPLILVLMAGIVFPIVLAIMLPMYSMYDSI